MKNVTATKRFAIETERDFDDLMYDLSEMMKGGDGHKAITSPQLMASYLATMTDSCVETIEKSIENSEEPYSYYSQAYQKFILVDGYLAPSMKEQVTRSMGSLFEGYQEKFKSD